MSEFDKPWVEPSLPGLADRLERCHKPVVAAIHGICYGGGLELALACHRRIASPTARMALPEVLLGLLPGAGGTQRLPRLIGARAALKMMLEGAPVDASTALALGLVDLIAGDLAVAALEMARQVATDQIRRTGDLPLPKDLREAVLDARENLSTRSLSPAQAYIIDSVAVMDELFSAGQAVEARLFTALLATEASRGLRHAFFGERKVARIPGLSKEINQRDIKRVGVVGGGVMGTGIAIALLNAGLDVTIVDLQPEVRARAEGTISATIQRDVNKGRIDQRIADARFAALCIADDLSAMSRVDLVIEAVFEDIKVKEKVFTALEQHTRPDAILASNTSTLDLDVIAGFVKNPSRVIGLHFFSPANIMKLLEIVQGRETAPELLVAAMAFAKRIGKIGVISGVCDGFIGNRIFEEYLRQVYFMLEEGALPQQIDAAMEKWGMAMGPCRTMDLAGQDIGWAIRKRRAIQNPERPYSGIPDRICERGRFGQKSGKGFYLYADGRTARVDPEIEQLIVDYSDEFGIERREISDDEIINRSLLAMINEGAKILEEGIAYRPIDIDMTYLLGYGFARERGGPMFQADLIGLPSVFEQLKALAQGRNGWTWTPSPLIGRLAASGESFESLNQ
ncbi:3-hydroxyacyl-CoA dehydrogenase NAD-binding domain-containing protein [Sphingobium rhizovicinum]